MITLAMLARAPAPCPWPIAIGTIAATSITVVIRIGRSRVWLASTIASWRGGAAGGGGVGGGAGGAELVRRVDLEDPVLLHDPDEHEQPEHRVQVHRRAEQDEREKAERDR